MLTRPVVEGRVLQGLELTPTDHVQEIGTGSGFLSGCLAKLSAGVTSLADFIAAAGERLAQAGIANVKLEVGEAIAAWHLNGLFDALVVSGAVYQIPQRFLSWLKPDGRMLVVRGESPVQQVLLLTHVGNGRYREEVLFETDLPYLKHAEPPRRFVF